MKSKLLLLVAIISLASCSPNIVNTWNIDKYEVVNDKGQNTTSQNIGTITFKKNGKGTKDIHYNVLQNDYLDKSEFTYELHEDYIVIKSTKKKDKSALNKMLTAAKHYYGRRQQQLGPQPRVSLP